LGRYCSLPSVIDIWKSAAIIFLMGEKGIIVVLPPFLGCLAYSSSSVGIGNSSKPDFDQKNATLVTGAYCNPQCPHWPYPLMLFLLSIPVMKWVTW
jgi:hypothetical protein